MAIVKQSGFAILCAIVALAACGNGSASPEPTPPADTTEVSGDVEVFVTTASRSRDLYRDAKNFGKGSNMSPTNISLDPNTEYQKMDGFGVAITGATAYNLLQMEAGARKKFLEETFSPEKFGFSYVRISIGCSDFSVDPSEYTCCDKEGIENFALQSEEKNYVIPVLKEILAINPELKIMGSPWTAPRWMKVKDLKKLKPFNSWTDGYLNPKYYADYATYFVKWIEAMKGEEISIYSVTPQNEPLNRGNSASMFMGWEQQRDFVKVLGPALKAAGLTTKIFIYDHNYDYSRNDNRVPDSEDDYVLKLYDDEEAAKWVEGAAYHAYGGNKSELERVHNRRPDKGLVFTETSIGTWNDGRNLEKRLIDDMEQIGLGTVNNWSRGVIVWNLMLDFDRGPYSPADGSCKTCYGAVDISLDYRTITRNSHYYVIAHLASVVKPGAVRIAAKGFTADGLTYAAFRNPDGSYAFVASNGQSKVQYVTVSVGTKFFTYELPAKSVVSFRWKA